VLGLGLLGRLYLQLWEKRWGLRVFPHSVWKESEPAEPFPAVALLNNTFEKPYSLMEN
jgi:hypothetical protein